MFSKGSVSHNLIQKLTCRFFRMSSLLIPKCIWQAPVLQKQPVRTCMLWRLAIFSTFPIQQEITHKRRTKDRHLKVVVNNIQCFKVTDQLGVNHISKLLTTDCSCQHSHNTLRIFQPCYFSWKKTVMEADNYSGIERRVYSTHTNTHTVYQFRQIFLIPAHMLTFKSVHLSW